MTSATARSWMRRMTVSVAMLWLTAAINPGAFAAAAEIIPPDQLVKQTTEKVLKLLREHPNELKEHPARIYHQVQDIVIPHFDFQLMSRFVLAQDWRRANSEQRKRFVREFRRLLVQTYGYSLSQYSGQTVNFSGMQTSSSGDRALVKTVVKQSGGPDIPVDYRLHKTAEGWKVYDVMLDGVSLVQNYRSSFREQIRRKGLDRFLDELQQRNAHPGQ